MTQRKTGGNVALFDITISFNNDQSREEKKGKKRDNGKIWVGCL